MISFEHDGERITFEPGDGFNSGGMGTYPATYKRCLPLMLAMLKEIARLERDSRNRDMWKGQCERQAEALTNLRGVNGVLVGLLRECLGPLEVSAAVIDSDDNEQMEALIEKVRAAAAAMSPVGEQA